MNVPILFTGRNVEVTDSMKSYIEDKINKLPHVELATQISVEVGKTVFHKGADKDFYVRILMNLPKAVVRMKKDGGDVYVLVDDMMPSLHAKLVKYKDNFRKWDGAESWPEAAIVEDLAVTDHDESASAIYAGYVPPVRRKVIKEMPPMSVTEAIERMELLDKSLFIFKDVQSGNVAVVVKKDDEYEMVIAG
ncbi:MAG: ribosome-associated translation inhibitor RaiA [Candidatus Dojkabacteria bacterium]|nr:MAG: ribosome-associated translation inhibitor RaiA [Candidatus Dojkabacteria bacterium]